MWRLSLNQIPWVLKFLRVNLQKSHPGSTNSTFLRTPFESLPHRAFFFCSSNYHDARDCLDRACLSTEKIYMSLNTHRLTLFIAALFLTSQSDNWHSYFFKLLIDSLLWFISVKTLSVQVLSSIVPFTIESDIYCFFVFFFNAWPTR